MAVSEMFRTPALWRAVADTVRWNLARRPGLSVLSGGCAHGYEAYSAAVLLLELGRTDFTVTAVDVDAALIGQARTGHVPASVVAQAVREGSLDAGAVGRHLTASPVGYTVAPQVLERITFDVADLAEPACLPDRIDVAFTRNVWRHLPPTGRQALAGHLADAMPADSPLALGGSDFYGLREPTPTPTRNDLVDRPELLAAVHPHFTEGRHELLYRRNHGTPAARPPHPPASAPVRAVEALAKGVAPVNTPVRAVEALAGPFRLGGKRRDL